MTNANTTPHIDPRRIAFIGFGEAGSILAQGLVASGRHDVAAYDLLLDDATAGAAMRAKAQAAKVTDAPSPDAAAEGARIIISAVTAASAREVAVEAAGYLRPGQIFLDINSVAPETKRANAAAVERTGAQYVEAAVMAPVPPYGLKVPMLLGGAAAAEAAALLSPAGMQLEVGPATIGQASAIKMCRSIMIKGIEALTVECFLTARRYGVEDRIVASLDQSFPLDWEKLAGYLIGRTVQHGRRRAAEVREVAATVSAAGLAPLLATATAERQDWVADQAAAAPALKSIKDAEWRTILDQLLARLHARAHAPHEAAD
jgi:3-hydroxyisobutyrate dehydrogenase-like beta-hydroxyacid dehydrogenase